MARFRASLGRILTIGSLATATGAVAVYRSELTDRAAAYAQQLDSSSVQIVDDVQNPVHAAWDNDWDRRGAFVDLTKSIGWRRVNSSDEKNSNITIDSNKETVYNKEGSDELQKKQPKATRHLIFVRHGQYNSGKKLDEDRRLTDLGRKQALCTGDRLKSLNIKFDRIIHSTMTRAKETAELIKDSLDGVSCESCSLLREGAPCPPEPSSSSSWNPERWEYYQDGSRIEAAFRKYFHRADVNQSKDSHELIVCHANVIRYFVCRALQFPPEGWLRMSIANCALTQVTIRPNGRVTLKSLGDAGHLPPDQITFR